MSKTDMQLSPPEQPYAQARSIERILQLWELFEEYGANKALAKSRTNNVIARPLIRLPITHVRLSLESYMNNLPCMYTKYCYKCTNICMCVSE